MAADATMSAGVVVERREASNPWQAFTWACVDLLPGAGPDPGWRELARGDGAIRYLAATLDIELHRGETEGYKTNLSQQPPCVYVVLRPDETGREHDFEPFLLTVCPFEAMSYTDSGEEIVEGVTMPAAVAAWVQDFVDAHHRDEPFTKRVNKRHRNDVSGSRPRGRFGRAGR